MNEPVHPLKPLSQVLLQPNPDGPGIEFCISFGTPADGGVDQLACVLVQGDPAEIVEAKLIALCRSLMARNMAAREAAPTDVVAKVVLQ